MRSLVLFAALLSFALAQTSLPSFGRYGKSGKGMPVWTTEFGDLPPLRDLTDVNQFEKVPAGGVLVLAPEGPGSEDPPERQVGELGDEDEEQGGRRLNVFLPDTRAEVTYNTYPGRTVGFWDLGCTATLIDSKGVIVTNAHCMDYNADGSFASSNWNRYFYAGLKNGVYLGRSKAKAAWYDKANDYCVMKLVTNLASTVGNMGAEFKTKSYFNTQRALSMFSYSGDHCTAPVANCRVKLSTGVSRGTDSNGVRHDLDAKRGSSGSTMFKNIKGLPYHQALNFAEYRNGGEQSLTLNAYSNNRANLAKPGQVWYPGWLKVKDL